MRTLTEQEAEAEAARLPLPDLDASLEIDTFLMSNISLMRQCIMGAVTKPMIRKAFRDYIRQRAESRRFDQWIAANKAYFDRRLQVWVVPDASR